MGPRVWSCKEGVCGGGAAGQAGHPATPLLGTARSTRVHPPQARDVPSVGGVTGGAQLGQVQRRAPRGGRGLGLGQVVLLLLALPWLERLWGACLEGCSLSC